MLSALQAIGERREVREVDEQVPHVGLAAVVGLALGGVATYWTTTAHGFRVGEKITIAGLNVETAYLMSFVLSLVIMVVFFYFFRYSRYGLAMRATAYSQQVAQSLGISVKQVFAMAWGISALVSCVAGVVLGLVNAVSNSLAIIGIKVFPAVIVGGLDSIVGAVVGGVIIGLLENFAEFIDGQYLHIGNMYTVAPFYVLIIILMIRPYGLFGTENIERM